MGCSEDDPLTTAISDNTMDYCSARLSPAHRLVNTHPGHLNGTLRVRFTLTDRLQDLLGAGNFVSIFFNFFVVL